MAGLLGTALGWDKNTGMAGGLYKAFDSSRNALAGLSSAVVGQPDTVGVLQALAGGATAGAQTDRQLQKDKIVVNQTLQYLQKNDPTLAAAVESGAISPGDAYNEYFKRQSPAYQSAGQFNLGQGENRYDIAGNIIARGDPKAIGSTGTPRAGVGQPIYARNRFTGQVAPWQSMTDGTAVNITDPSANPSEWDFNPGIVSGERSGATVDAKTAAEARAALPAAEQSLAVTKQSIQALRDDKAGQAEQFGNVLGVPQQMTPAWPGSAKGNFQVKLSQAQGQSFLQARQFLKGQGAITDMESGRAEGAYSRLEKAVQLGDAGEFNAALDDFEAAIDAGLAKVQATANGNYSRDPYTQNTFSQPAAPGQTSGQTTTGVPWSFTP